MPRTGRRFVIPALLTLAAAVTIGHIAWKGAGINDWQLARDENGIQVFTLKTPGQTLLKVKARMKLATSLSSAVALSRDNPFGAGDSAAEKLRVLERIETPSVFLSYIAVEHQMPPPFHTREFVVLMNYAQDTASKRVEINIQAAPTKAPPGSAARVVHLNNVIRLTPSRDGQLEWEIAVDVDLDVPYPLANFALPRELFDQLNEQKERVLAQKYRQAQLVSVREL